MLERSEPLTMLEGGRTYLAKTSHHLLYERAHGCNVDYFEVIHIYGSIHVYVLSYFP